MVAVMRSIDMCHFHWQTSLSKKIEIVLINTDTPHEIRSPASVLVGNCDALSRSFPTLGGRQRARICAQVAVWTPNAASIEKKKAAVRSLTRKGYASVPPPGENPQACRQTCTLRREVTAVAIPP
jgi:hypothetical protein